jgi:hypothetical protein
MATDTKQCRCQAEIFVVMVMYEFKKYRFYDERQAESEVKFWHLGGFMWPISARAGRYSTFLARMIDSNTFWG